MKRWYRVLVAAAGLTICLVAVGGRADEATDGKDAAPTEDLRQWQWYMEIAEPKDVKDDPKYLDFLVPPAVFDKANVPSFAVDRGYPSRPYDQKDARPPAPETARETPINELSDLRLRDANGHTIQYALFVRRKTNIQAERPSGRINPPESGPNHSVSVSLEIKGQDPRHNEIEIGASGKGFRRHFTVETSDDQLDWKPQLEGDLIYFEAGNQVVNLRKFTYPVENRRRFVRVTVQPDAGVKDDKPVIEYVRVYQSVEDKGLYVTLPADVGARVPARVQNTNGSAWPIAFGGKRVPVETLIVKAAETNFDRPFQLKSVAEDKAAPIERFGDPFPFLTSGNWKGNPLRAPLNPEIFTRQLRLEVADAANAPLTIESAEYEAPARQIIFARSPGIAWPVRVYFGNPAAEEPRYDFRTTVTPSQVHPYRLEISSAEVVQNPKYTPPAVAFSEQYPWLVYGVLGVASVVLLGIMGLLAKQALTRTKLPLAA
jgi:hypothetical protein